MFVPDMRAVTRFCCKLRSCMSSLPVCLLMGLQQAVDTSHTKGAFFESCCSLIVGGPHQLLQANWLTPFKYPHLS